ncbi:hypothetical protein CesoFtcFv8_026069 [Champsocephalus esox]|uniref:Uncharacterized protein n=1 Tax=Champsocephalus esox TaxID=159716 RepID=A0AAN8B1P2_9TELE|nr:hypothetical protein CesoFtcFv8_026069 [Champsocephalus esox]
MKAETHFPAFTMEEEEEEEEEEAVASLGLPPLTSQSSGGSWQDINIFIAATAAHGLFKMSLLGHEASKGLVVGDYGRGGD